MQKSLFPEIAEWPKLAARPVLDQSALELNVKRIMGYVRLEGDVAIRRYTKQFDGAELNELLASEAEIDQAVGEVREELKEAIKVAATNIRKFHEQQFREEEVVETMPGVTCWRKLVPIEKVGLYVPGGSAPLFSTVLMLGLPALIAGCGEIVLCTPPMKDGRVHPAVLFAAKHIGIKKIIKAGGVQAIAAMAYGTDSVPRVSKIFGPGNQYVTCAKMLLQREGIAIDMPAGPSEVAVYADATADPEFVAADLLSQAEHGPDSQVLLVGLEATKWDEVEAAIDRQLAVLPRKEIAAQALAQSRMISFRHEDEAMAFLNEYAAEHLILNCANAGSIAAKVVNAGSVFIGALTPESVGDYASGTNHTLPTNGYARAYSGVSVDSFVRKITFQKLTEEGLKNLGPAVVAMAEAEELRGHANAVRYRLDKLNSK